MNALLLTSIAALSTSLGGYCTVLLRRQIPWLMAFGAGVLLGAATLDLHPAAWGAASLADYPQRLIPELALLGALTSCYMHREGRRGLLEQLGGEKEDNSYGKLGASLLILHSAMDGSAIFAASQISVQTGLMVGLGVIAHDLCDGLNTILLSSGYEKPKWHDYAMLACDAVAPVLGCLWAGQFFSISPLALMTFLSFASGSFLYTATYILLPDAYGSYPHIGLGWISAAGFVLSFGLTIGLKHFG
jgi:zinc transporter ZupT